MHAAQRRVAVRTRAHVEVGVAHVAGIGIRDAARAACVAREDAVHRHRAVGRLVEHRRGGQEGARVAPHADRPAAITTVPPDLVPVATVREVVTDGQVLDAHPARLEDLDTVAPGGVLKRGGRRAGRGGGAVAPVDDDQVPVHAAQVNARLGDHDAGLGGPFLVIDPRPDEDPVARLRPFDGARDGPDTTSAPAGRRAPVANLEDARPAGREAPGSEEDQRSRDQDSGLGHGPRLHGGASRVNGRTERGGVLPFFF